MTLNDLELWSFILAVCAFVLCIQTLLMLRTLILMRPFPLRFLPIILVALAISMWAFIMSLSDYDVVSLLPPPHIHLTEALYQQYANAIAHAVIIRQFLTGFTVISIGLLALIERKMLPTVERTPLWVKMRERRLIR